MYKQCLIGWLRPHRMGIESDRWPVLIRLRAHTVARRPRTNEQSTAPHQKADECFRTRFHHGDIHAIVHHFGLRVIRGREKPSLPYRRRGPKVCWFQRHEVCVGAVHRRPYSGIAPTQDHCGANRNSTRVPPGSRSMQCIFGPLPTNCGGNSTSTPGQTEASPKIWKRSASLDTFSAK